MIKAIRNGCLVVAMGGSLVFPAMAADPEAIVDYRQGVMSSLGGNAAASAAIIMDGVDFRDNLEQHARILAEFTRDIPALFPEGSDVGDNDAREAVWSDRQTFEERAAETRDAAEAFYAVVREDGTDREIMAAFRDLGQSCRACHDDFRD
ncbi:c-type cytochrome [Alkalilimnicola ehrlichii MLHE-1]|uniref:Cytochrome c, class II n=1 Tax=Alkalilimnicola ehrlichii (strain ATCC BAA-1101 / DSM 17681 / MLHE-1) TaxID=187272 RepID=Q0A9H5_ALKEH|nr:cytochrome c [Alkalilimnicola ehrlichii]ABI56512.1 cytochrome c, class II [Alkalilimnicola ehrlichii MLHE-1]